MDIPAAVAATRPYRVGFVLIDGFPLLSYASAMEPLRACNLLAGQTLYELQHLAIEGESSYSSSGAHVSATMPLDESAELDLVLVMAGGDPSAIDSPVLNRWLRLQAGRPVLVGGVSGGPMILARAGIMEGRRMTVHWEHAQALAQVSSKLIIERSLYVRDRDRLTCAGGTAALDMMHALITEQHGPVLAGEISEWFVQTDIRPAELAQRATIAERYGVDNGAVLLSIEAMENHLADPLELSQLASLADLGARQLNRLFQQQLGTSVVQFYRQLRLQKANELLKSTPWSVENIALATGFANGAHLSRRFTQFHGLSPRSVRRGEAGGQGAAEWTGKR
ncbi:GlxA family transcriptional regulator [Granulosicoccus sp. 3-233]|uniref:GlxA family transcriptional regulator n=1 Tax=Granulosicoccus sp. 3-233 TaxID=3417969 RepID=UPI003D331531